MSESALSNLVVFSLEEARVGVLKECASGGEEGGYIFLVPDGVKEIFLSCYDKSKFIFPNSVLNKSSKEIKKTSAVLSASDLNMAKWFELTQECALNGVPIIESKYVKKITCVSTTTGMACSMVSLDDLKRMIVLNEEVETAK